MARLVLQEVEAAVRRRETGEASSPDVGELMPVFTHLTFFIARTIGSAQREGLISLDETC